jgi:hypothetical protein
MTDYNRKELIKFLSTVTNIQGIMMIAMLLTVNKTHLTAVHIAVSQNKGIESIFPSNNIQNCNFSD